MGKGFIKQYARDHILLRTEPATKNVAGYAVNKNIDNLPQLWQKSHLTVRTPDDPHQKTLCYLGELNSSAQARLAEKH